MKQGQSNAFDYAQSNWRQSIAVKIAAQIIWILIPMAFIASLFLFNAIDKYVVQNFEYKVDSLTHRITSTLFNNTNLTNDDKTEIIESIARDLGFKAVKVIASDYKLIPAMPSEPYDSTNRTAQLGFGDLFENEFVVVTGYHEPLENILKDAHKNILITILVCLTILAAFLVYSTRQKIYKPLNTLVRATESATSGKHDVFLDTERNDEFGHLSVFFKKMLQRLNKQHNELKEAAIDAAQANSAKSVFLANMSHELRTPLNAIIGYSELVADDLSAEKKLSHASDLNKITYSAKHLLHIINEILDLSKIEAGKLDLSFKEINVSSMLESIEATIEPLVLQHNNKLIIECADDVSTFESDDMRVRQILINLLGNACKFTENGEIGIKAELQYSKNKKQIKFTVSDTGTGISDELIDKLFDPFTQGDESTTKSHSGTGLGLSICYRLCILLEGDITVKSVEGKGTSFVVTLPLKAGSISGNIIEKETLPRLDHSA